MVLVYVLAGILGYVFLARIFMNLMYDLNNIRDKGSSFEKVYSRFSKKYVYYGSDACLHSMLFPITLFCMVSILVCKIPMKLADFVTNPKNYKFSIKIERK